MEVFPNRPARAHRVLFALLALAPFATAVLGALPDDVPPRAVIEAQDLGWPRQFDGPEHFMRIHQPQVESWPNFERMTFTAAVALGPKGGEARTFGVVRASADTDTAFQERLVVLTNIKVEDVIFADLGPGELARVRSALDSALTPERAITISLDRVLTELDITTLPIRKVEVSVEPPTIFYSPTPAVLTVFFGTPLFKEIPANELQYAVNTNWDVMLDSASSTYYLLDGDSWLATKDLEAGPWMAASTLPRSFYRLPGSADWSDVKSAVPGKPADVVPTVFVSREPAELIVTDGPPALKTVPGTSLMMVMNTDSDILFDPASKNFYALLAGRWFMAPALTGPWSVPGSLPADFMRIPEDSDAGSFLVSIPGTPQANEAAILASIPQRAVVTRTAVNLAVTYSGEPVFDLIPGTPIRWALNTPFRVFGIDGTYYCCDNAVWFCSPSPRGNWVVCDRVPDVIYTIPPSHPAFNVTYVRIFGATPAAVTFGFTAGYYGVNISPLGSVVFGVGRLVHAINHADDHYWHYHYPPYAYSYGSGARYEPATGAFISGGSVYGPYGGAGRFAVYNPTTGAFARGATVYGPRRSASVYTAYNPVTGNGIHVAHGTTPYGSWGKGAVTNGDDWVRGGYHNGRGFSVAGAQNSNGGKILHVEGKYGNGMTVGRDADGDLFAGRDGRVYRRGSGGNFEPATARTSGNNNSGNNNPPGPRGGPGAGSGNNNNNAGGGSGQQSDYLQRQARARDRGEQNNQRTRQTSGAGAGNNNSNNNNNNSGNSNNRTPRNRRGG